MVIDGLTDNVLWVTHCGLWIDMHYQELRDGMTRYDTIYGV
jgi:hypothetical protein